MSKLREKRKPPRRVGGVIELHDVDPHQLAHCDYCDVEVVTPHSILGLHGKKVVYKQVLCEACYSALMVTKKMTKSDKK